jgi:DNA mismatch endonuclease, patch repair protein
MRKQKRWPSSRVPTTFGALNRSQLMSRVRSWGNKTTEHRLASLLRANSLHGWRRHYPLRGKPDFVWLVQKVAVFVDGCFWHGHQCGRNLTPKHNAKMWRNKIIGNQRRDRYISRSLRNAGWSVCRIWECALAKQPKSCLQRIERALKVSGSASSLQSRRTRREFEVAAGL